MTLLCDESSSWGLCPQTPGIYRIPARMTARGGRSLNLRSFRPLSRRSGCVPAVRVSMEDGGKLSLEQIQAFYQRSFNPYMNFHRPCGQPEPITDARGKEKFVYRRYATGNLAPLNAKFTDRFRAREQVNRK
jgi:hypothetical protein